MFRRCVIIVLYLVIIQSSLQLPLIRTDQACFSSSQSPPVHVFLTISSLYVSTTAEGVVKRQLEVNWVAPEDVVRQGDSVGVFQADPRLDPSSRPVSSVDPSLHPGGFFRTDVELPVAFFGIKSLDEGPCLGYWVAYKDRNGAVLSSSCLRIYPRWMGEGHLDRLRLWEAMIPGSHDSGSFHFHKEPGTLAKYKYAQEEPIFNQLVYGLRYFDLRVGYYKKSAEKYYINHNFLRTEHSVKSVLQQVLKFLRSTREIVILDFHNFPVGFGNNFVHFRLMNLIVKTFGSYVIPHTAHFRNATFGELWASNKRILISYDSKARDVVYQKLLWPGIPRAWGNKQDPKELKEYFHDFFQKPTPKGMWASMAELTPNARTIVLHPETGLRVLADKVNRNVTHWFRDLYWQKANVVATDYFLGNDLIDVAIRANNIKATCPQEAWPKLRP